MTLQEHGGLYVDVCLFFCRVLITIAIKVSKKKKKTLTALPSVFKSEDVVVALDGMYQVTFVHSVNLKGPRCFVLLHIFAATPTATNSQSHQITLVMKIVPGKRRQVQHREHNYLGTTQALA